MRRKPGGIPIVPRTSNIVLSEDEHDGRGGTGTSDDDMMSDSESSIASLTDRKKSFEQVGVITNSFIFSLNFKISVLEYVKFYMNNFCKLFSFYYREFLNVVT